MDLELAGRCFVVTGGSRGLGRATAEALVADGATVVIGARSKPAPFAVGADRVVYVEADLGNADATPELVGAALERFGRVDGALLSVGGPPAGAALDVADDTWRTAFESVFLGPLRTVRALAPHLHDTGSIVFVLSSSAKSPVEGLAISNGLRPGLAMLVKQLADELGPRGVRVNGLLPGRVATDRVRELDTLSGDADAARARHEANIPLRRYGVPAEFGRVAAFLLSPAASYVTGSVLPVDGGALRAL